MTDRGEVWERRAEKTYDDLTYRPGRTLFKWGLGLLGFIIALAIVFGVISWVGSWGDEAKRITSPNNVREQNTKIIEDWEGMRVAAQNACSVSVAPKTEDDPLIVENPSLAYDATYRRLEADYNRRMANLYEAQAVRNLPLPSNLRSYPKVAPPLKEAKTEFC